MTSEEKQMYTIKLMPKKIYRRTIRARWTEQEAIKEARTYNHNVYVVEVFDEAGNKVYEKGRNP